MRFVFQLQHIGGQKSFNAFLNHAIDAIQTKITCKKNTEFPHIMIKYMISHIRGSVKI